MILHDLSVDAVDRMVRNDLAVAEHEPDSPIAEFAFHGCTGSVGAFTGRPNWECHTAGDELLLVLDVEAAGSMGEVTGRIGPPLPP